MKGIDLKNFLRGRGWNMAQIAELIGESRQNFNSLITKEDVKTGLIERISQATGIPLLEFYGHQPQGAQTVVTGDGSVVNNGRDQVTADPGLVGIIQEQQSQMSRLIAVIENLSKK